MDIKFTMVMDKELAQKMSYIGDHYGRARIKEIEWACKLYVKAFEKKEGPIDPKDLPKTGEKPRD